MSWFGVLTNFAIINFSVATVLQLQSIFRLKQARSLRMVGVGLYLLGAAALSAALVVYFFPTTSHEGQDGSGILLGLHVAGAVMGQLLAFAATVIAGLYLWQHRLLKTKRIHQMTRGVPALDILDRVLIVCLWTGFLFLTVAVISGFLFVKLYSFGWNPTMIAKMVWALSVWLWFLGTIMSRNIWHASPRMIAYMGLGGFLWLALAFFGLVFVDVNPALF